MSNGEIWNGVSIPNKPDSFGATYTFPEDLTILSPQQIGAFYSKLGAYKGFVKVKLGSAEISVIAYGDLISAKVAQRVKESVEKGAKRSPSREDAASDPEIFELSGKLTEAKIRVKKWETLYGLYDSQMTVLSREISRRENKF